MLARRSGISARINPSPFGIRHGGAAHNYARFRDPRSIEQSRWKENPCQVVLPPALLRFSKRHVAVFTKRHIASWLCVYTRSLSRSSNLRLKMFLSRRNETGWLAIVSEAKYGHRLGDRMYHSITNAISDNVSIIQQTRRKTRPLVSLICMRASVLAQTAVLFENAPIFT